MKDVCTTCSGGKGNETMFTILHNYCKLIYWLSYKCLMLVLEIYKTNYKAN